MQRIRVMVNSAKKKLILSFWAVMLSGVVAYPDQDGSIYRNYASEAYTQESGGMEDRKYYDLFGTHIADGYRLYDFSFNDQKYFAENNDSIARWSNEYKHNKFYAQLNALCITQDEIGKAKSMFIVGDQIYTKFTPLTLNMRNFGGLRWDLWSSAIKMTTLISRTRPGIMARAGFSGNSYVTYPQIGSIIADNGDDWYLEKGTATESENLGDWTQKTLFGDYDMLMAMHAQNNFANIMNVGITYINHHRSDIAKGEKFFKGELPAAFAPREIHFEVSDLTPDILNDAGACINSMSMLINGRPAGGPFGIHRIIDEYAVYRERDPATNLYDTLGFYLNQDISNQAVSLPCTTHGREGIVLTFQPIAAAESLGIDSAGIRSVEFVINVAGNYLIFSSCEKLTPQNDAHFSGGSPKQLTVEEVAAGIASNSRRNLASSSAEVYFGEYLAQSPVPVMDYSNARTIRYSFTIPVMSVTYGVDINGKIGNFSYNGEYAVTSEISKHPFLGGIRDTVNRQAGYLQLKYAAEDRYDISADIYNIDADFHSGMGSYYASKFFNAVPDIDALGKEPQYLSYARVFDNDYTLIDDNDDDDYYVENNRRRYPAEGNINNKLNKYAFYNDGTIKGYAGGVSDDNVYSIRELLEKRVLLPTGLYRIYEDLDGVIVERYDRNKNGLPDYQEDFMLYSVDMPIFNLESDNNNNAIYDIEEDDLVPDLPYQMGYVYAGNGLISQGIRGVKGEGTALLVEGGRITVGGLYEKILDNDLDGRENAPEGNIGLNRSFYLKGRYDKNIRTQGIAYFGGFELKRLWDGIKNDAVITNYRLNTSSRDVDYTIKTDELRYLDAFTGLMVAGIDYRKIANLTLTGKVAAGLEKHYGQDDPVYITRSYVRDVEEDKLFIIPGEYQQMKYKEADYYRKNGVFKSEYKPYTDKSAHTLHLLHKGDYVVKFVKEHRGRYSRYLNVLHQLKIIPKYYLLYINNASDDADPRDVFIGPADSIDTEAARFAWNDYRVFNEHILYAAPILQLVFKMGEQTQLEAGGQIMFANNFLVEQEDYLKRSFVAQVVNRSSIKGFDVSIIMGFQKSSTLYSLYSRNEVFGFGHENDIRNTSVFCKIFAGFKNK